MSLLFEGREFSSHSEFGVSFGRRSKVFEEKFKLLACNTEVKIFFTGFETTQVYSKP